MSSVWHHLDTTTGWRVYPEQPGEIKTHGPYHFKWSVETPAQTGHSYYSYSYSQNMGYVSLDKGITWVKYDYSWINNNAKQAEKVEQALVASREIYRKARSKKLAKERKIANEKEAKKKGISVEDLMASRKADRDALIEENRLIMRADKTQKLMKAGPTLKKLYDDLGVFLRLIADGKSPKLPYFEQYLRRIEDAQERVQIWRQSVEKE